MVAYNQGQPAGQAWGWPLGPRAGNESHSSAPHGRARPEYTALVEHLAGTDDQVRRLAGRIDELAKLVRGNQS